MFQKKKKVCKSKKKRKRKFFLCHIKSKDDKLPRVANFFLMTQFFFFFKVKKLKVHLARDQVYQAEVKKFIL